MFCSLEIKKNKGTQPDITKKRYSDSHRSTVTTQTQNKTRQNYYAILPVYAGEAYVLVTDIHIYINSFRLICTL